MADAKGLQELLGYFETGDSPSESDFTALINSMLKVINGTFDEGDVDEDFNVTLTYPASTVNGNEEATLITEPIHAYVKDAVGLFRGEIFPCVYVDDESCTINLGTKVPAGTYNFTMVYQR